MLLLLRRENKKQLKDRGSLQLLDNTIFKFLNFTRDITTTITNEVFFPEGFPMEIENV